MLNEKIRIRLKAYDHKLLDQSAGEIVDTAKRTGAVVRGPVVYGQEDPHKWLSEIPAGDADLGLAARDAVLVAHVAGPGGVTQGGGEPLHRVRLAIAEFEHDPALAFQELRRV